MKQVTVKIPATTANLGPGFDCLGLALGLYNLVTLSADETETAVSPPHITITGEGAKMLPADETNLVFQAAEKVFSLVGKRPSRLHIHQENNIPVSSGLGSSAAATLGGLVAANALVEGHLSDTALLEIATEIEGHPDNVVPAFHGGLTLAVTDGHHLHVEKIALPTMKVIIILPDFHLPTAVSRAALPQQVALTDAVFNIGRTGLVMRAFERGDFDTLAVAMKDKLHQPYRVPLIPGMVAASVAALEAGAAAVTLSGAGPSMAAFAPHNHETIAQAALAAFTAAGVDGRYLILPINNQGYEQLIQERPDS